ncbi:hypothetical protein GQ53DRAFT_746258 [Thozetella sp. PMI_491]|nr:hypothetical protein GQ53DRAFT_746258 [Thozetella sp. PMI_491]
MDSLGIPRTDDAMSSTDTSIPSVTSSPRSVSNGSEPTSMMSGSAVHLLHNHSGNRPIAIVSPESSSPDLVCDRVEGWPRVANLMAQKPGIASFSRFLELNIQNLLYYQVELAYLENKLHQFESLDSMSRRGYESNARKLVQCGERFPVGSEQRQQWDLVCKIRTTLKEYNEALVLYKEVTQLPEPDCHNVDALRVWLTRSENGNLSIIGSGSKAWGKLTQDEEEGGHIWKRLLWLPVKLFWQPKGPKLDLVTLPSKYERDRFVRWISHDCVPVIHSIRYSLWNKLLIYYRFSFGWSKSIKSPDEEGQRQQREKKSEEERKKNGLETYSEKWMQFIASSVATVVACVLPTVAIGILSTAQGTMHKLLYIGGFTMLFAIGLIILTDCSTSRIQIFTATAAFSAVLVVFVQNQ